MICHNCGCQIDGSNVCPNCGSDIVLMKKAKAASLRQYNKGVSLAKEGDYFAAIKCLNRCILMDKRNYVARNLLGISYYQVGMIGDALKQWIISSSLRTQNNPAQKYIDAIQKNARLLEKYNDAVRMYNKALDLFKCNSNDLGIIQLKKAVSLNPNFVEAYNLLTAYYLSVKDKEKAKEYAAMALKCDKRNSRALYYLSIISSGGVETSKKENSTDGYNSKKNFKEYIKAEVVAFIVGIVITSAVIFTLVVPSFTDGKNKKISNMESEIAQLKEENQNGTSAFALKYAQLEEENTKLKEENQSYKTEESAKQQKIDYQLAEVYILSNRFEEAANLLSSLQEQNFSAEENQKIESMKQTSYTPAAEDVFEKGREAFNNGDNASAKELLSKSLAYTDKADFSDDVLYMLGQIAENDGDKAQAIEYYGRVVNEFANSNVFKKSEEKLNNLLVENR